VAVEWRRTEGDAAAAAKAVVEILLGVHDHTPRDDHSDEPTTVDRPPSDGG
jgi:hypothetical protein